MLARPQKPDASTTFRWISAFSGACAVYLLIISGLLHWWTSSHVIAEMDRTIADLADTFTAFPPEQRIQALQQYVDLDQRGVRLVGLFAADGSRVGGNVEALPSALPPDGAARELAIVRVLGHEAVAARTVLRRLADGSALVVARNINEGTQTARAVEAALAWSAVPILCFGLTAGTVLNRRARARVDVFGRSVHSILAGNLRERLPVVGTNDVFDEFAVQFNAMLDEMEALIRGLADVGDQIAHDLRAPLTSVRMVLERGRDEVTSLDEVQTVFEEAIGGLDRSLDIITALRRIAEIDQNQRMAAFSKVALAELVNAAAELYEPLAESKNITLAVDMKDEIVVWGDRDLLFEAIANLVDNAVKYTPEGGRIELKLCRNGAQDVLCVSDTGPGIPEAERELVTRRFYRSESSRHTAPGLGLGLSLVHAIVKLHGFQFAVLPEPGCVVQIALRRTASPRSGQRWG
jgi:signal transduction histidine kinase